MLKVLTEQANLGASKGSKLLSESVWVHSNILPSGVLALSPARLIRRVSNMPALSDLETFLFWDIKKLCSAAAAVCDSPKALSAYWNHLYMLRQGATSAKVHLLMDDSVIDVGQMIDTGHTNSVRHSSKALLVTFCSAI